eukprot:5665120-Amphidinium_carterae.1
MHINSAFWVGTSARGGRIEGQLTQLRALTPAHPPVALCAYHDEAKNQLLSSVPWASSDA